MDPGPKGRRGGESGSIGGLLPSEGISFAVLIGIAGSAYALFALSVVRRRR